MSKANRKVSASPVAASQGFAFPASASLPASKIMSSVAPVALASLVDKESRTFETVQPRFGVNHFHARRSDSQSLVPMHEHKECSEESPGHKAPKLSVFLGSRCTRVHFVRHAEGIHNVATRQAGEAYHALLEAVEAKALAKALEGGLSHHEATVLAHRARVATLREEENRPVHHATPGADRFTDAELTHAGENQCYALRGKIDRNMIVDPTSRLHVDLVVVSPLRRCLQTADIIFGPGKSSARPDLKQFLVHDLCRERFGEFYCDKRNPLSENRKDPRFEDWDWDTQEATWPDGIMEFTDEDEAWGPERESEEHVMKRAMRFLQWLSDRPERELAVVTHSSFLKNLFKVFGGDTSQDDQDVLRAVPANCELRTVVLCHHGS